MAAGGIFDFKSTSKMIFPRRNLFYREINMTDPYWLAFGDIHDDFSRLDEIPELADAAGIIVTGDITLAGGIKQAAKVLEAVSAKTPLLYAQIGNMDRDEVTGWLEEKGWNLHARARALFPGVMALGVGCSPFTPFGTPSEHPESRLAEWMEQALAEARELTLETSAHPAEDKVYDFPRLVLIAHTPPHASACDRLHNGTPVGSTAVREFIEEYQPEICICGHIHEARGEDRIGKTHVINPGTLGAGGYVILRQENTGEKAARVVAELKILP